MIIFIMVAGLIGSGCKKMIEVDVPYTSFSGDNTFTTDATAIAAVTNMYARLGFASSSSTIDNAIPSITFCAGLSADELTLAPGISGSLLQYYTNSLTPVSAPLYWNLFYENIYFTNAAIEGLTNSNTLTAAVKQQLLGEAYFMRAFSYFYLVNLYGDVPLVLTTNYQENSLMARTSVTTVWPQIIKDLEDARANLNNNYSGANALSGTASTERVRPNKGAATALLARVYLYLGDNANAENMATEVITNTTLYSITTLGNTFLKNNNNEAIWQIQGVTTGWNTHYARVFVLPAAGPGSSYPVYLNKRLVNAFEAGDKRKDSWISGIKVGNDSFYYAYKYKSATLNATVTEYNTVFRLAEQYLIRAEARAQQVKLDDAKSDLNVIRTRAGLGNTTAKTKDELLNAIINERRFELFTEWGHRWLDLKRTNKVDEVMRIETPLKGGKWEERDKSYPISNDELLANPNLSQTSDY